ncbi:27 kDa glycoprotein-like isoform X2 [Diprion similis]|uniref:27 kDa glycoprotein-like isoform X2 n=1 Tax=Diprion similis TaxID=362088 RepID=UPI001EF7E714|nr:27 kDa glycoprotein-like isoform X2 [Diprion similis]
MRIHKIFMPLLIGIGILGFTDARLESFLANSVERSLFAESVMMNENDDATEETQTKEAIMKLFTKTCEKNGGPGALTIAFAKIENIQHCLLRLNESINVDYSYIEKHPKEMPKVYIEAYCPHVSSLESCVNDFKKDNPCLGPVELESFEAYRDSAIFSLNFGCENKGENFKTLMYRGGIECLMETGNASYTCMTQEFGNDTREYMSAISSTSKRKEYPWNVLAKDDCANLEKFHNCHLNAIQRCKKPEVTNVIKGLWNQAMVGLRCRSSANSQPTPKYKR